MLERDKMKTSHSWDVDNKCYSHNSRLHFLLSYNYSSSLALQTVDFAAWRTTEYVYCHREMERFILEVS